MRIRKQQRMEILGATVLPATLLQERDSRSSCSEAVPYCISSSRSTSNWLDKLRASKGFPLEPKLEIEEFVRSLHGNSLGDSKSSGMTGTPPLVSTAENAGDCITTTSEKKRPSSAEYREECLAGDCKDGLEEGGAEAMRTVVQFERCDSFDPDGFKARPSSSGHCMKLSNSSEGLSQACPSEGSSQKDRTDKSSSSPGISNADNGNAPVTPGGENYAFGLPREDFEPSQGCVTTVLVPVPRKPHRKRKQPRPRSCPPSNDPGQEVTGPLLQRRTLELFQQQCKEGGGSPESPKTDPACRTQLALREEYMSATPLNCSDEKNRSCASLTTSCMEKMRNFSLRSSSCTESDGNGSDSTSDSLTLHRKGMKRMESKDLRGAICSKRRKLDRAPAVTPFQVEGTLPMQRDDYLQARRRTSQTNGFFDIASSMLQGSSKASPPDPPDHPACQPKDTLVSSIYQVFMKAGKNGLTAREAVSKILEEKLPGLGECSVVARSEVGKIVRTSPYFMELEESRFVLCSAITGIEDKANAKGQVAEKVKEQVYELQNWAALAVRRARTGKTRRKPIADRGATVVTKLASEENSKASSQRQQQQQQKQQQQQQEQQDQPRKRRLKSVQQDSTGLGNRCNRSDGKGWHCPLLAQVGYLLCDHHLDRLRAKSGSKPRRPNRNRAEKRGGSSGNAGNGSSVANRRGKKRGGGEQSKNGHGRSGLKAPVNTNSATKESWGVRQTLGVARVGQKRQKTEGKNSQQEEDVGEEEVATFGLRF